MTKKLALMLGILATWGTGFGCVHYDHTGLARSLTACHDREMEFVAPVRQKVYLFMMNGADVADMARLNHLRDRICAAGYPKIYIAQRPDVMWYEYEIRRIAREDPHARMILLGFGSGAEKILPLASGLVADGVKVDTVVLLDPACAQYLFAKCHVTRTVVIRSHHWKGNLDLSGTETLVVENIGHILLANAQPTVDAILRLMIDSAALVGPLDHDPLPTMPLSNKPNPTPRGEPPILVGQYDEWDFLKGPPPAGVAARPIDPPYQEPPPRKPEPKPEPSGERLPSPRTVPQ